jgi:hypothetical protein
VVLLVTPLALILVGLTGVLARRRRSAKPIVYTRVCARTPLVIERLRQYAVPIVLETATDVRGTARPNRRSHRLDQDLPSAGSGFSHCVLDFGEGLVNEIEVRRVGRRVHELASSFLDQVPTLLLLCAESLSITVTRPGLRECAKTYST